MRCHAVKALLPLAGNWPGVTEAYGSGRYGKALRLHENDRPLGGLQVKESYLERETGLEPATLCFTRHTVWTGYDAFSQTETWLLLSLVKGSRIQPLQRSRKVIPASCAIRSSSDGHT